MRKLTLFLLIALLTGCISTGKATLSPVPAEPTWTPMPAFAATPVPIWTSTVTPTHTASPTSTSTPTATATPTPTSTPFPPVTLGQEVALNPTARSLLGQMADLPRYEISATVDIEALTVSGHLRAFYTNRQEMPLTELYWNLYPNSPRFGQEIVVSNVSLNGKPLEPHTNGPRLAFSVPFSPPLLSQARVMIEMDFVLHVLELPENDLRTLVYSKDILSLGGWYPMIAVLNDGQWQLDYPEELIGEAMFAESAFHQVQLTVPQTLVIAATGVQTGETVHSDGTRTLTFVSGPARTFYVAAAADYQVLTAQSGDVTVHSYYRPGHEECGQWELEAAQAALKLYGELYGSYPLSEFDVVEADYAYQGFEWPGLILIGGKLYEGTGPACGEWFVAHETAHQWWYNIVGNDPVNHPWLDEALAQYSTMLYYRRLWSADAAHAYIQAIIYDRFAPYAQRPEGIYIDQPTTAFEGMKDYFAIVYAHGAMFMEQLHEQLGDEAFFAAMKQYNQENQFQIAEPETLYNILKQADPDMVDTLWAEWVTPPKP